MDKAKGSNPQLAARHDRLNEPKTLSEMGVTKDQSNKWQKLAGATNRFEANPGKSFLLGSGDIRDPIIYPTFKKS